MSRAAAPTCTPGDIRACVPPVSGPVEEVSFLKVEKVGRIRAGRRGRRTVFDRSATRSPDVGEKKSYLFTPNNISHVLYPGVYPIGMARGDMARTYRSAWLTTSSSPRWLVLHPRASELLAIFITVPSYTGYVEQRKSHGRDAPSGAGRGQVEQLTSMRSCMSVGRV